MYKNKDDQSVANYLVVEEVTEDRDRDRNMEDYMSN